MQADVFPLIVFDLDRNLGLGLTFGRLDLGLDRIVPPADRNSLRKLTLSVRHQFPLGFFPGGTLDLDRDTGDWAIVWSPNGSHDQSVVFVCGVRLQTGIRRKESGPVEFVTSR